MRTTNGVPYADLRARAIEISVRGPTIPVAGRDDLVRMKRRKHKRCCGAR